MSRFIWWTASIFSLIVTSLLLPLPSAPVSAAPLLNLTTTATPIPPTATPVPPPTETPVIPPTETPVIPPPTAVETATPEQPTNTPRPRDNDDPDPSPTPLPPTETPLPPETPVPTEPAPRNRPNINKSADPSTAMPGSRVTFTITVRNSGSSPISNVEVRDSVPGVFEITGASTSQGTVDVNGQSVHAQIGTIAPGDTVQITISTVVRMGTPPGQYDNVAIVTEDTPPDDPGGDPGDNTSTTTVTVTNAPRALPPTGETTAWPWQLLLIALVALFGGVAFLARSRARA